MKYILGIDQGGSKTHAAIAEETGTIIGLGKGAGACHSTTGMDVAMEAAAEAVAEASAQANISLSEVAVIGAGMTGVDWDFEAQLLEEALRKRFGVLQIAVVNDAIIAMRSGTTKRNSAVICAGTGLNCAVKKGEEIFTYGFYIPDEHQGGVALGKKAVQAVFDSHMGLIAETSLTKKVLELLKVGNVDELLYQSVVGKIKDKDYSKLPIMLEEEAIGGDEIAIEIWREYGEILANYVIARMRKMDLLNEEIDIVLSGSILKCKVRDLHEALESRICGEALKANITKAKYEPVVGAVLLGLDYCYENELPPKVYENMEKSTKNFALKRM